MNSNRCHWKVIWMVYWYNHVALGAETCFFSQPWIFLFNVTFLGAGVPSMLGELLVPGTLWGREDGGKAGSRGRVQTKSRHGQIRGTLLWSKIFHNLHICALLYSFFTDFVPYIHDNNYDSKLKHHGNGYQRPMVFNKHCLMFSIAPCFYSHQGVKDHVMLIRLAVMMLQNWINSNQNYIREGA